MRGEPSGWGVLVFGSCQPGYASFSETLRTAFTYGYDWLGRELSRSPGPDGGSDMRFDGQRVDYRLDLPGLSQVLLTGENGSLYLFDGTTSALVASGPLTQPLLYVYPSRGQTFICSDEALVMLSRVGTRLMPLPRESYGSFGGFFILEDGSILAIDGRTAVRIKDTAVQPLSTRMPPGAQPMDVSWNPSAADANRVSVRGDDGASSAPDGLSNAPPRDAERRSRTRSPAASCRNTARLTARSCATGWRTMDHPRVAGRLIA